MTNPAPNDELAALRTHNAELLAELKAAKARAKTAEDALQEATAAAEAAQGELRAVKLDGPVQALLEDAALDGDLFGSLFGRHYQFALDDTGAIVVQDPEGKVPTVPGSDGKPRPATFTRDDVVTLARSTPEREKFDRLIIASRADGGGAHGSRGIAGVPDPKPDTKPEPRPSFGIR